MCDIPTHKTTSHPERPFSHYINSHRLAAEMWVTMKNKLPGKQVLSRSFYRYRFRKYVFYGFPIINFCNLGVHYETPCTLLLEHWEWDRNFWQLCCKHKERMSGLQALKGCWWIFILSGIWLCVCPRRWKMPEFFRNPWNYSTHYTGSCTKRFQLSAKDFSHLEASRLNCTYYSIRVCLALYLS